MAKNYLWTQSRARLHLVRETPGDFNWLFLPGGPGLGSESLNDLIGILALPGAIWQVDLPGDGSNIKKAQFQDWSAALFEATEALDNVILVAHSAGGMFALANAQLQETLTGLILMNTAPDSSWQQDFTIYVKTNPLPAAMKWQNIYESHPSDENLKEFTAACVAYAFTERNYTKAVQLIRSLPINHQAYEWAAENFHPSYQAQWVPKNIPVLIFAGELDRITPVQLFKNTKEFNRPNILIQDIQNAAHYPWLDNPEQVRQLFREYCQRL